MRAGPLHPTSPGCRLSRLSSRADLLADFPQTRARGDGGKWTPAHRFLAGQWWMDTPLPERALPPATRKDQQRVVRALATAHLPSLRAYAEWMRQQRDREMGAAEPAAAAPEEARPRSSSLSAQRQSLEVPDSASLEARRDSRSSASASEASDMPVAPSRPPLRAAPSLRTTTPSGGDATPLRAASGAAAAGDDQPLLPRVSAEVEAMTQLLSRRGV